jgi:hypothetical protein
MLSAIPQNTPLRASLGAERQALLASPSRGEVNPVNTTGGCHTPCFTLPLEGRVAKLGSQSTSVAREGVSSPAGCNVEKH